MRSLHTHLKDTTWCWKQVNTKKLHVYEDPRIRSLHTRLRDTALVLRTSKYQKNACSIMSHACVVCVHVWGILPWCCIQVNLKKHMHICTSAPLMSPQLHICTSHPKHTTIHQKPFVIHARNIHARFDKKLYPKIYYYISKASWRSSTPVVSCRCDFTSSIKQLSIAYYTGIKNILVIDPNEIHDMFAWQHQFPYMIYLSELPTGPDSRFRHRTLDTIYLYVTFNSIGLTIK